MTRIHVKSGQRLADAIEASKHARQMEIVSDAAIACAQTVEAARLAERERCAKIADQEATRLRNGGAINAARAIAAAIRQL